MDLDKLGPFLAKELVFIMSPEGIAAIVITAACAWWLRKAIYSGEIAAFKGQIAAFNDRIAALNEQRQHAIDRQKEAEALAVDLRLKVDQLQRNMESVTVQLPHYPQLNLLSTATTAVSGGVNALSTKQHELGVTITNIGTSYPLDVDKITNKYLLAIKKKSDRNS